jgi:hypothetical protein
VLVCRRSIAGTDCSNFAEDNECSSLVFVVCCVGSGLCDGLITCSEVLCMCVPHFMWSRNLNNWPHLGTSDAEKKKKKLYVNILLANNVSFAFKIEAVCSSPKGWYLFTNTHGNRTQNSLVLMIFHFSKKVLLIQVRWFYTSNWKFSATAELLKLLRCQTTQMPTRSQRQRNCLELVGLLISMPRKQMITQKGKCIRLQN